MNWTQTEIEEEITADHQPEVSSMKVPEIYDDEDDDSESAKKEDSHLEQVDLLSNVPDFESSLQSEDLLEDIEETREDGDEISDVKVSSQDEPTDLVGENVASKEEEEYQQLASLYNSPSSCLFFPLL